MDKKKIVAIIPIRKNSRRIKNKNFINFFKGNSLLETKIKQLKTINLKLWDIEDNIRLKEKNKQFDNEFIELARSVYITNDERAKVKLDINILTKSELIEVKSYEKYHS